jgi:hemerythrin
MNSNKVTATELQGVDAEHQVQMRLLMALQAAIREQRPAAETSEIRFQLTDFCRTHFLSEELLMRRPRE